MKRDGMRVWCCATEGCEYVACSHGECPAHRTQLMLVMLAPLVQRDR